MLTYNNALVSDIQRLIDYTRMPTKLDGRTVAIKTIDSFFLSLMKEFKLVKKELNPSMPSYTDDYKKGLEDLYSYVVDLCDENDIVSLKDLAQAPIDWDYILIDEAQDFSDDEKEILFKLYGANRLVVADGVDQFMRTAHRQQWGQGLSGDDVWKPKEMQLERRQRANLVTFVNAFAQAADLDWKVRPNSQLPGGEVKIYRQYTSDIHIELTKKCQKNKCENYDILILVPPNMVVYDNENNNHSFKNADKYKSAGINIFDGTSQSNKATYPTKDECRLYQYRSCRGLEGWCVVCTNLDEVVEYEYQHFNMPEEVLGLDRENARWRAVMLWTLMPLTRPQDTLVITLKDPNSRIGEVLKQLSEKFNDFVEWNIEN